MNEIRRVDRHNELLGTVRAVLDREGWPDYIVGYDLRFEDVLGDPAVRVIYGLKSSILPPQEGWEAQADELNELRFKVSRALQAADDEINAYVGFKATDP